MNETNEANNERLPAQAAPNGAAGVPGDEFIKSCIFTIRGEQVVFSPDLAMLYGVSTKRLNEQVKRNRDRFPERFMFQLSPDEAIGLRSQIATSNGSAKTELVVIDPYFDDSVLPLIAQKRNGVAVVVVKNSRNKLLHAIDVARFNAQYANSLVVTVSDKFHDRFLVIDRTILFHVGASLNHLGKRCFAFATLDKSNIPDILAKI